MTARSDRPINRLISWVRPPIRPLTDSRSERVLVEAGSMAYSAVTQPRPPPLPHRGTPSEADAAHSTRVLPNSIRTDPAGWSSQSRVILMGRSSSSARPSSRVLMVAQPSRPRHPTDARAELLHFRVDDPPQPDAERQHDPEPEAHDQLAPGLGVLRQSVGQEQHVDLERDPGEDVGEGRDQ